MNGTWFSLTRWAYLVYKAPDARALARENRELGEPVIRRSKEVRKWFVPVHPHRIRLELANRFPLNDSKVRKWVLYRKGW